MSTDLRDQIDQSFGSGPDHRDVGPVVDAGRRALRRRRLTSAAGGALAVAVLAGGITLLAGGPSETSGQQDPVASPTATSTPTPPPYEQVPRDDPALEGGQDVVLAPDGTLYVRQGIEVLEVIPDPMGVAPPRHSIALSTSTGGEETWWLLESSPRSSSASSELARQSFPDLTMWVDDQVAMERGEPTLALVEFGPDGTLVPDEGVEILEQRAGIDLGPSFAGPEDPTAVAEVRWRGERWYVLARHLQGTNQAGSCGGGCPPEYFPTAASVSRPTLDGFLSYARASYDEGTGLR